MTVKAKILMLFPYLWVFDLIQFKFLLRSVFIFSFVNHIKTGKVGRQGKVHDDNQHNL